MDTDNLRAPALYTQTSWPSPSRKLPPPSLHPPRGLCSPHTCKTSNGVGTTLLPGDTYYVQGHHDTAPCPSSLCYTFNLSHGCLLTPSLDLMASLLEQITLPNSELSSNDPSLSLR